MVLHYYATKRIIKNGEPVTPANYPYTDKALAQKQFYLLCANAIVNSDNCDKVSVEWGTLEQGQIDRQYWEFKKPEPAEETPAEGEE